MDGDLVRIRLESVPSYWLLDRVTIDYSPPAAIEVNILQADYAIDWEGCDVRSNLAEIDGGLLT